MVKKTYLITNISTKKININLYQVKIFRMRYKGIIINKTYYCNFVKITFEIKWYKFCTNPICFSFTVS